MFERREVEFAADDGLVLEYLSPQPTLLLHLLSFAPDWFGEDDMEPSSLLMATSA